MKNEKWKMGNRKMPAPAAASCRLLLPLPTEVFFWRVEGLGVFEPTLM